MEKVIFVTGGCGFIGSNLVRLLLNNKPDFKIVNIDCLTYAGHLENLSDIESNTNYFLEKADIRDMSALEKIFMKYQPSSVMHLAAESHVDRSIDNPSEFIETNIIGTFNLLHVSRKYFSELKTEDKELFRFLHVSTDEVYGSLGDTGLFTETTPYEPSSPYSASKASSDHLVRAWHKTYGLPTLITNCSNNYGPYQFPEKLIPLMTLNAVEGKDLPIYGNGKNVRDWLYVEDHAEALVTVLDKGRVGETYNIGGENELTNVEVVDSICQTLGTQFKNKNFKEQIKFVSDRPGHDQRYAIDCSKIKSELGWSPKVNFEEGIKKTIQWYLDNKEGWCAHLKNKNLARNRKGLGE